MSITRLSRPQDNFYMVRNEISGDRSLSWAARGMLIYLLSKPEGWKVNVQNLINETAESGQPLGRDGVYSVIRQLIDAGYMRRIEVRDAGKIISHEYEVGEALTPLTAQPEGALPLAANPDAYKEHKDKNTEKEKSPKVPKGKIPVVDGESDLLFDESYKAYPHVKTRKSPKMARRSFDKLPIDTKRKLPTAIKAYRAELSDRDLQYVPAMEVWINQEKYLAFMPDGSDQTESRAASRASSVRIYVVRGCFGWDVGKDGFPPTDAEIEIAKAEVMARRHSVDSVPRQPISSQSNGLLI